MSDISHDYPMSTERGKDAHRSRVQEPCTYASRAPATVSSVHDALAPHMIAMPIVPANQRFWRADVDHA